jgi:hypothetical protein
MTSTTLTRPDIDPDLIDEIQTAVAVPTLADLIEEGSQDTVQSIGWGDGVYTACALKAAECAAARRGLI